MTGRVDHFNDAKGFGFIVGDDDRRFFAHYTEIKSRDRRKTLRQGQRVAFDPVPNGAKGDKAANIRVIE